MGVHRHVRLARDDFHAPGRQAAGGLGRTHANRPVRRDPRRRRSLPRAAAAAIPFLLAARLEQRPQRAGLLSRRVSSLLPAQSVRLGLGQHALGPRGEPRPGALGGNRRRAGAGPAGADVQRHRRSWIGRTAAAWAATASRRRCSSIRRRASPPCSASPPAPTGGATPSSAATRSSPRSPAATATRRSIGTSRRGSGSWRCTSACPARIAEWTEGARIETHTIHFLTSPNLKDWSVAEPHRGLSRVSRFLRVADGWRGEEREMGAHGRQQRIHAGAIRRHELHGRDRETQRPARPRLLCGTDVRRDPGRRRPPHPDRLAASTVAGDAVQPVHEHPLGTDAAIDAGRPAAGVAAGERARRCGASRPAWAR